MKRMLLIFISFVFVFSMVGCGKNEINDGLLLTAEIEPPTEEPIEQSPTITPSPQEIEPEPTIEPKQPTPTKDESVGIEVDEGLLNVTIIFPASMFEDMTDFDPDAYTEENNFKETVINEDGSISVTMSKRRHNELVAEMETVVEETFQDLIEGENTPYVKEITASKGYRTVTVSVDKETYKSSWDFTPFMIWISVGFYQLVDGADFHCEVIIEDVETGEILNTIIYPDALEN